MEPGSLWPFVSASLTEHRVLQVHPCCTSGQDHSFFWLANIPLVDVPLSGCVPRADVLFLLRPGSFHPRAAFRMKGRSPLQLKWPRSRTRGSALRCTCLVLLEASPDTFL